jgi:hypothetical protein
LGFWFVIAHLLLFKLYFPNRYTGRFLLLLFVLLAAIALIIFIDGLLRWHLALLTTPGKPAHRPLRPLLTILSGGLAIGLAAILVLYPLTYNTYPSTSLQRGEVPEIYEYFVTQPKDSVIASLAAEANNIPSFAGRTVLVSPEIALPYHLTYYREIEQRAKDLIAAQFTTDPDILRSFIQRYGITHWLIAPNDMDMAALKHNRWVLQYQPQADQALVTLASGQVPVLAKLADRCETLNVNGYSVLDAQCIATAAGT